MKLAVDSSSLLRDMSRNRSEELELILGHAWNYFSVILVPEIVLASTGD